MATTTRESPSFRAGRKSKLYTQKRDHSIFPKWHWINPSNRYNMRDYKPVLRRTEESANNVAAKEERRCARADRRYGKTNWKTVDDGDK